MGIIEDINSSALKLFSYEKHEVMGQNIKMLMPEPHRSNHSASFKIQGNERGEGNRYRKRTRGFEER